MSADIGELLPIMDVQVGDVLPAWVGTVTAIRDTPRRRYFTIQPHPTSAQREPWTGHQDNRTNIFVRRNPTR